MSWRRPHPGETFEHWRERVGAVWVTDRDRVTGEAYVVGWGWYSAEEGEDG